MPTTLQNFYKATITRNWTATTGDFNVSVKPTTSSGWLVISANNTTLREIVYFNGTGTNAYGDYVTIVNIADRGLGGTTAQTHTIGETIRMNVTAEHWAEIQADIAAIIAAGAPNASTTTKGLVEEATQTEVDARTAAGGTGARLFVNPSTLKPVVTSVQAKPASVNSGFGNSNNGGNNTVLSVGRIYLPNTIVSATKFSFEVNSVGTPGTIKVALFSEDGATQLISFTTATISASGSVSTTITSTTIPEGTYYVTFLPVGTASITLGVWAESNIGLNHVSGEPVYCGKTTVTASTMPSTITPTSLTFEASGNTLAFQLDN